MRGTDRDRKKSRINCFVLGEVNGVFLIRDGDPPARASDTLLLEYRTNVVLYRND